MGSKHVPWEMKYLLPNLKVRFLSQKCRRSCVLTEIKIIIRLNLKKLLRRLKHFNLGKTPKFHFVQGIFL
jgi:hypothetical protein